MKTARKPSARTAGGSAKRAGTKSSAASASAVVVPDALKPTVASLSRERGVTVEKGWGSSSVALKSGGKIFAMLIRDELVLKLPKPRVDELVEKSRGARFDPRRNGKVMKEWIVLSAPAKDWVKLAGEAHRFVTAGV